MPRPKRRANTEINNEVVETIAKRPKTSSQRKVAEEKFSTNRLLSWFKKYTTEDDPTQLGPEGMERFCSDIHIDPENIGMLCIAFVMQAKHMGYFTQAEFIKGLSEPEIQCDTPTKLQNKLNYFYNLMNDPQSFKLIFRYAYDFARDKDQRSMDIETAKAMLSLLLKKSWPLFPEFEEFLQQPKAPRVINKDQWNNIYEFSRTINVDLSNYSIDGAWPVLLDDFVDFLHRLRAENSGIEVAAHQ